MAVPFTKREVEQAVGRPQAQELLALVRREAEKVINGPHLARRIMALAEDLAGWLDDSDGDRDRIHYIAMGFYDALNEPVFMLMVSQHDELASDVIVERIVSQADVLDLAEWRVAV